MDETPIIQNTDKTLDDPAVNAEIVEPAVDSPCRKAERGSRSSNHNTAGIVFWADSTSEDYGGI